MTAPDGLSIHGVGVDTLADVAAIMQVAFDPVYGEAWSPSQCLAVLTMPGYAIRVALLNDTSAGFAIIRWVADESELLLLAVRPQLRGQGVGSSLIRDWLKFAGAKGARRFFLEMRTDNPAQSLYAQQGFSLAGRRPDYYRGADGLLRDALTLERIES